MRFFKLSMILLLTGSFSVAGQDYFFRQYDHEEGLHHSFVYVVNQDRDGFLWIGTGEGLYRFDGIEFEYFTSEDGLADNFITEIFRDSGGDLWIGHQSGAVSFLSENGFVVSADSTEAQGSVTDIKEDNQGGIWATVQNVGLVHINREMARSLVGFPLKYEPLSQMVSLGNDYFLIGSQENLYLSEYQDDSSKMVILNRVEDYPGSKVVGILPVSQKDFIIISQDEGIYQFSFEPLSEDYTFSSIDGNGDGVLDNLQGGILTRDGVLWLNSMGSGMIRYLGREGKEYIRTGRASEDNGLISDNVRSLFEDAEGNLWLGMYGDGLLRYVDNSLRFYHYDEETESDRTHMITGDNLGLYAVVGHRLLRLSQDGEEVIISVPLPGNQSGDVVNTAYLNEDGRLWLGFEKSGLYVFSPAGFKSVFISNDDLANSVNHITGKDGYIWVSTKKGICMIQSETGLISWFTTDHGLPHNNIQQLFQDSQGRVLVATLCSELYYIHENKEVSRLENSEMGQLNSVMSISEDGEGAIWAGTQGQGVWRMLEGNNINFNKSTGLLSDFCYSLTNTGPGVLVVGHRGGISRIDTESERIRTFSRLEGINSSAELYPNAIFNDQYGNIWFGTSEGLVKYSPNLSEGGMVAPKLQVSAVYVDGERVDKAEEGVLLKPGYYELAVEYVGIHLSNPEMVVYQTKLDGYSKNWSELTPARRVVYERVGHGSYSFRINAFNENNLGAEILSGFELRIKKPVYLTFWFYTAIFILLLGLVYLIIKLRERKQKQLQLYLQNKLDERTQQVIIQNEEIELKNKDITDSINYAQKIQASILPPVSILQALFGGAFVFYRPKDIVSGDFYWYGKFENDIFVIACADSTGHGVPGAFMSMIGTTLLKDICGSKSVDTPSKVLNRLDKEVITVLSQNRKKGGINDGMDITIAEINLRTNRLCTASAMRPVIIYKDGEPIYFNGNRFSIGGQYSMGEKTFDKTEYMLNKGDKIYLFTDGFADQFGGPRGKKFKSGGIKNLLQDIHEKPMVEQYRAIKNTFDQWKGDTEQVDDVLFMGIEL